jgi:hypothetical protein
VSIGVEGSRLLVPVGKKTADAIGVAEIELRGGQHD